MSVTKDTKDTLIILDWDDTILPTYWLEINKFSFINSSDDLVYYQECCYNFFNEIIKNGHVIIITNAEKGWVEKTCQIHLPKIWPIVSTLKIISAKTTYIETINCQSKWKELAFKNEIELYIKDNPNILKNLISFGDSHYERSAILNVHKEIKDFAIDYYIKSVKFADQPTLELLILQLDIITTNIKNIVDENSSLDLMLIISKNEIIDPNNIYDPNEKIANLFI